MKKRVKSLSRFRARELESKIIPAIKLLSQYMFNTTPKADEKTFKGYKLPAGEFVDDYGVRWQIQITANKAKKDFIRNNEIVPIIPKWAIMFKLRLFAKILIDKLFEDEVVK